MFPFPLHKPEKGNILIVDDTPDNLSVLRKILMEEGHRVRPAISGEIALKAVENALPDLILLDIVMPGMDGFEVCRRLKSDPLAGEVPVIFISALNGIEDKIQAFSEGGVDYISKPFHSEEVSARVSTHLTLRFQQKELKQRNRELKEKNKLIAAQAQKLETLVSSDFLTGLSNRRGFMDRALHEEKRFLRSARPFAFILLDIDHFKQVNDIYGHECGDNVLTGVARTLEKALRRQDMVARWGGEEFICLLPETGLEGAGNVAEKVRRAISGTPLKTGSGRVTVTATLGVSEYTGDNTIEACIRKADQALYRGKAAGRNRVLSG